ncbi:MAG: O-antigen ligase family protein [Candidatus Hydrogenedentes bacterium]|nr:O-antigen ligase family protein [Candidatus Hydrogenedentota bacterium]
MAKKTTPGQSAPDRARFTTDSQLGNLLVLLVVFVVSRAMYLVLEELMARGVFTLPTNADPMANTLILAALSLFAALMVVWTVVPRVFGAPTHEVILAAGLGGLVLFRPWVDGITYPEKNPFFMWLAGATALFWALCLVLRREKLRYPGFIGLLALFLLVAALGGFASVQRESTWRALLNWTSYLLIFAVAASGLRSRSAIAIVLGLFIFTSIAETVWSILHVKYLMPLMRESANDPALLQRYFGTSTMTDEIRSRLSSNRAMGSLLFANALACWVLTGIPLAAGGFMHALLRGKTVSADSPKANTETKGVQITGAVFIGFLVGFALFYCVARYYSMYFAFEFPNEAWTAHPIRWAAYCVIVPVLVCAYASAVIYRKGLGVFLVQAQAVVLAAFFLLQLVGLAYTYSRGGMLATVLALGLGAWLVRSAKKRPQAQKRRMAVAALMFACATWAALASAQAAAQAKPEAANPSSATAPQLQTEGKNPSLDAMMDPVTASLRLSYWKSGVKMALANSIAGVGLGNFGAVYPKYQLPNSADVKQAHNDFLQMFCETGVPGGILFALFWGCFGVWGIRRIRRESVKAERWLLAGVFCGVVGFLLHSAVDMNFPNPSLATLVFLLAGLFLALAANDETKTLSVRWSSIVGAGAVVAVLVLAVMSLRILLLDNLVGNKLDRKLRLEVIDSLLGKRPDESLQQNKQIILPDRYARLLISDVEERRALGKFYVRVSAGSTDAREVGAGELLPDDAFLVVLNPGAARAVARQKAAEWITRIEESDARFPYDPSVCAYLYQIHDLLYVHEQNADERLRLADACLRLAEESVQRSPEEVPFRNLLARALWRRGEVDQTVAQLGYFDRSIEAFAKCIELYPSRPDVYFDYAKRCQAYGEERKAAGDAQGGQALIDKAQEATRQGEALQKLRQRPA